METSQYENTSGRTTIAPEVLLAVARLTTLSVPEVSRMGTVPGGVNRLFNKGMGEGVRFEIREDGEVYADLYVVLKSNTIIRDVCHTIQYSVARAITETVGMPVGRVNVHVEDIDYPVETEAID